ncbi:MAG: 50S ribosomal protein L24 [Acidobacteriota bacterium]
MTKLNIKKGDQVLVIAGKDRGTRSKVLRVDSKKETAIVEQVNLMKKHTKPNPQKQVQGGVLETEAPIRLSNLMVICPETGKPTRVGRKTIERGGTKKSVRVAKVSGATLD